MQAADLTQHKTIDSPRGIRQLPPVPVRVNLSVFLPVQNLPASYKAGVRVTFIPSRDPWI